MLHPQRSNLRIFMWLHPGEEIVGLIDQIRKVYMAAVVASDGVHFENSRNEKAPANAEALWWLLVMASLLSRTYRKVPRNIWFTTGPVKQLLA